MLRRIFAVVDGAAAVSGTLVGGVAAGLGPGAAVALAVAGSLAWLLVLEIAGLYAHDDPPSWTVGVGEVRRVAGLGLLLSWPAVGLAAALGATRPALGGALAAALAVVGTVLGRAVGRTLAHRSRPLRQNVVILGSGVVAEHLVNRLRQQPELGLDPVGIVDDDPHRSDQAGIPVLGGRADLADVLARGDVDRVIIAFSRATHEDLMACMRTSWDAGVAIDVIPRLFELLDGARRVDRVGGLPVMAIDAPRLSATDRAVKRAMDVAVSGTLLILLAPVLLLSALAVKLTSPGSVFFRQERAGRGGRPFELLKLRSMRDGADSLKDELATLNEMGDGVMFKIREDPRVTPVGRWLRRCSLDELPQLVNVLRGDMSLVGPRPLVLPEHEAIGDGWGARRADLRPGITGPWQVYGRSQLPFQDMLRFDYQYAAGWSLARDLELLVATIPAVLSGRGAY